MIVHGRFERWFYKKHSDAGRPLEEVRRDFAGRAYN